MGWFIFFFSVPTWDKRGEASPEGETAKWLLWIIYSRRLLDSRTLHRRTVDRTWDPDLHFDFSMWQDWAGQLPRVLVWDLALQEERQGGQTGQGQTLEWHWKAQTDHEHWGRRWELKFWFTWGFIPSQALFLDTLWVVFRIMLHASTMSQTIADIHGSSQIFPMSEGMSF